jgi:hypothetical protein
VISQYSLDNFQYSVAVILFPLLMWSACNSKLLNEIQHDMKDYTTIHINEAISLVVMRALSEYRSQMTSHSNKTFDFFWCIKQIDFIVPCVWTVIGYGRRHCVIRLSSFHAMMSSVIYYSTYARYNEMYLLIIWKDARRRGYPIKSADNIGMRLLIRSNSAFYPFPRRRKFLYMTNIAEF